MYIPDIKTIVPIVITLDIIYIRNVTANLSFLILISVITIFLKYKTKKIKITGQLLFAMMR